MRGLLACLIALSLPGNAWSRVALLPASAAAPGIGAAVPLDLYRPLSAPGFDRIFGFDGFTLPSAQPASIPVLPPAELLIPFEGAEVREAALSGLESLRAVAGSLPEVREADLQPVLEGFWSGSLQPPPIENGSGVPFYLDVPRANGRTVAGLVSAAQGSPTARQVLRSVRPTRPSDWVACPGAPCEPGEGPGQL